MHYSCRTMQVWRLSPNSMSMIKTSLQKEDVENISPYFVENDIGVITRGEAVRNYLYKQFDIEHKRYDVETSFFTGSAGVPEGALSLADIVIFTTCNRTQLIRYNEYCRAQKASSMLR